MQRGEPIIVVKAAEHWACHDLDRAVSSRRWGRISNRTEQGEKWLKDVRDSGQIPSPLVRDSWGTPAFSGGEETLVQLFSNCRRRITTRGKDPAATPS